MPDYRSEISLSTQTSVDPETKPLGAPSCISVVIPLHNEADALPDTLHELFAILQRCSAVFEVLAIDDGSTDNSWQVLRQLIANQVPPGMLKAIRFTRNFGKESAISAGLVHATGDAVVIMDADGQHPPALILEMVDLWHGGRFQVVEAVKRRRQNEPFTRRIFAQLFYRTLIVGAELDLRNSTDYKLLDRRAVRAYLDLPEHGRFFRGLTAWMGLPTARLEIDPPARAQGVSSWRLSSLFTFARRTIVSFTALPLRLISWTGFLGFTFSLILAAQTLWNKLLGGAEEGFPTVILLILGLGSLILLSLGLIGEYVSEIYDEIKRRPLYVVCESIGPDNITSADSARH